VKQAIKGQAGRVFVAGGFIRDSIINEPPSDIDLFCARKTDADLLVISLKTLGAKLEFTSPNARSFSLENGTKIQVVTRWEFPGGPLECIREFDFTIAAAVVWWDGAVWQSVCHDNFYPDLAARRLVYMSPCREEEAGGSFLRLLKFYRRGYSAPLSTMSQLVTRIVDKVDMGKISDNNTMESVIRALLVEVDPSMDPDHIIEEGEANA